MSLHNSIDMDANSDVILFSMRTELGYQDIISILPDDCIISILSFLDVSTLETMESVSQKMHYIARHKRWIKPKKAMKEFVIQQMHDNYVVWVAPFAENEHSLMWNPLNVDLNKCEIARRLKYKLISIPGDINNAIVKLNTKFVSKMLRLSDLLLDNNIFKNIKFAFRDKIPSTVLIDQCTFDSSLNLSKYLLDSNINNITVYGANSSGMSQFDDDFIREFSNVHNPQLLVGYSAVVSPRLASFDLLPNICRYKYLSATYTLTLTKDMLIKLIKMGFSLEKDACWHFRLDFELDYYRIGEILSEFKNGMYSMEEHVIKKLHSIRKCTLCTADTSVIVTFE